MHYRIQSLPHYRIKSFKYIGRRKQLVKLLRKKGITDELVLDAIGSVPREFFVPGNFEHAAYEDRALPISDNQTISQPYTVAFQTQLLGMKKGMKILEIGTGSGYQCAILCAMGLKVFSIERIKNLLNTSGKKLKSLGYFPYLKCGDGTQGWKRFASFERILVTAGGPEVPKPLLEQLDLKGKLVMPVGDHNSQTMQLVERISSTELETQKFSNFSFVPLIGKHGWESGE